MKQQTFASQSSFEKYSRKSRRELFLDEMKLVVPWSGWLLDTSVKVAISRATTLGTKDKGLVVDSRSA